MIPAEEIMLNLLKNDPFIKSAYGSRIYQGFAEVGANLKERFVVVERQGDTPLDRVLDGSSPTIFRATVSVTCFDTVYANASKGIREVRRCLEESFPDIYTEGTFPGVSQIGTVTWNAHQADFSFTEKRGA